MLLKPYGYYSFNKAIINALTDNQYILMYILMVALSTVLEEHE